MEDISQISVGNDLRQIEDSIARKNAEDALILAKNTEAKVKEIATTNTNVIPKEGAGVGVTAVNNFINGFSINGVMISTSIDEDGAKIIDFGLRS